MKSISNPLRVAFVTGGLPFGGSTVFLLNLCSELARRSVPFELISLERDNPMSEDFRRAGIPLTCLDDRTTIFEDRLSTALERLSSFQPTVVIANLSASSFEVLRYLPAGVLRVGMIHSDDPQVYEMARHYTDHLDVMVGVSNAIMLRLKEDPAFSGTQHRRLFFGVPVPDSQYTGNRTWKGPIRVLYLGRLDRVQKRVQLFPEILAGLKRSGIPFQWTIAGDGPELQSLRSAMTSERPDQVISFLGRLRYDEISKAMSEHHVFLLASDYEGLPLSLLEAMAHGLVAVVSQLPSGIPDVLDPDMGRLVPPDDVPGYAREILWLDRNREEMQRMSERARRRVSREFTIAAMGDRWLEFLKEVPDKQIIWPAQVPKIRPLLVSGGTLRHSPILRPFRRFIKRALG